MPQFTKTRINVYLNQQQSKEGMSALVESITSEKIDELRDYLEAKLYATFDVDSSTASSTEYLTHDDVDQFIANPTLTFLIKLVIEEIFEAINISQFAEIPDADVKIAMTKAMHNISNEEMAIGARTGKLLDTFQACIEDLIELENASNNFDNPRNLIGATQTKLNTLQSYFQKLAQIGAIPEETRIKIATGLLLLFLPLPAITIYEKDFNKYLEDPSATVETFLYLLYASFPSHNSLAQEIILNEILQDFMEKTGKDEKYYFLYENFNDFQDGFYDLLVTSEKEIQYDQQNAKKAKSALIKQALKDTYVIKQKTESIITQFYEAILDPESDLFAQLSDVILELLASENPDLKRHVLTVIGMESIPQLYEAYRQIQLLKQQGKNHELYKKLMPLILSTLNNISQTRVMTVKNWKLKPEQKNNYTPEFQPNYAQYLLSVNTIRNFTRETRFNVQTEELDAINWQLYGILRPHSCSLEINAKTITITLSFDEQQHMAFSFTLDLNPKATTNFDWSLLDATELEKNKIHKQFCYKLVEIIFPIVTKYAADIKKNKNQSSWIKQITTIFTPAKKSQDRDDELKNVRKAPHQRATEVSAITPLPQKKEEVKNKVHFYLSDLYHLTTKFMRKMKTPDHMQSEVRQAIEETIHKCKEDGGTGLKKLTHFGKNLLRLHADYKIGAAPAVPIRVIFKKTKLTVAVDDRLETYERLVLEGIELRNDNTYKSKK